MTKLYKVLASSLLMLMVGMTAVADEKSIGYCDDEYPATPYSVGVSGSSIYVGAAIYFPTSVMEAYKGCQITKIRMGVYSGLTNVKVWVREGSLDAKPVFIQSVASTVDGWNEIVLDTPYDINGSDIYVGYNGKQPSDKLCILFDKQEDNANAMWVYDANDRWLNYEGEGWGSLLLKATVSGDSFVTDDLGMEAISFDKEYYHADSVPTMTLKIANQGVSACSNFTYSYQIDGGEAHTETVSQSIEASNSLRLNKEIDITGLQEGEHTLRAYINHDSYPSDGVITNDTVEGQFLVYEKKYRHVVLLEHFTTIPCVYCPLGNKSLIYATSGRDDVAWVAHHVGYNTDELTVGTSSRYMNFGVDGAPMAMIDRTYFAGISDDAGYPAMSIAYDTAAEGGEIVKYCINQQAATPAFVGLNIECEYSELTSQLTIDIEGNCNAIYQTLVPTSCLTVFLAENNVTAKVVQTGTSDEYTHNHVLRSVLTAAFGDDITWDGNSFHATYTATIDETWKPADINIIAFVSKPYNSSDLTDCEVQNACQCKLSEGSGIASLQGNDAKVKIEGGQVTVEGSCDDIAVYDASGARVGTSGLAHGLYIVKTRHGNSVKQTKLIY